MARYYWWEMLLWWQYIVTCIIPLYMFGHSPLEKHWLGSLILKLLLLMVALKPIYCNILNKGVKVLKKLWCCVGGEYYKIIWFYQLGWRWEFKQITMASATAAAVTEKVWEECVSLVCQILSLTKWNMKIKETHANGFTQRTWPLFAVFASQGQTDYFWAKVNGIHFVQ